MKKYLCSIIYILWCLGANAQGHGERDSLLRLLHKSGPDTNKVILLLRLGRVYESSLPNTAMRVYQDAHILSRNIGYFDGTLKSNARMANLYSNMGKNDTAIILFERNLRWAEQKPDSLQIGIAHLNLGSTYRKLSMNNEAIVHFEKGRQIVDKFGSQQMIANNLSNMQLFYHYLPNYEKALLYGQKAITMARQLRDEGLLMRTMSNMSMTYKKRGELAASQQILREALALSDKLDDDFSRAAMLINMSDLCLQTGDYNGAETFAEASLKLHREVQSKDGECMSLQGLAMGNLQKKHYERARLFAEEALKIATAESYKQEKANCFRILSNISYALDDVVSAERYYRKALQQEEEIANDTYIENAAGFEKRYETEKKEARIQLQQTELRRKNLLNYIAFGSVAALALILMMGYRNYLHKQKLQQAKISELETEKQLLATQSLLKGQEEERSRIAKDLHDGLGGMLSGVKLQLGAMKGNLILTEGNSVAFNRVLNNLEESIAEMRRVAHNMMPETLLKFGLQQALLDYCHTLSQQQDFTIQCEFRGLENRLGHSTEMVIYRIVQELINNAVKHSGASSIIVQLIRYDEEHIYITVEDNGKGFDPTQVRANSAGLLNITSRVKYLNGKMDIQSDPGKGTSVYIECEIKPYG